MSRKLKKRLIRIIITLVLFIPIFVLDKIYDFESFISDPKIAWILPLSIYLVIYFVVYLFFVNVNFFGDEDLLV